VSLTGVGECPAEPSSQSQGVPRVGRCDERTPPEIDQYVTIGVLPLAIIVSKTLALTLGAQGHFDNDKSGDMNDPKLLPRLRPNHPIHVDGLGKRPLSMPTVHRPRPHTRNATNRIRPNHRAERGR
jgi:hypothetical protein